jgi:hypothetical protein
LLGEVEEDGSPNALEAAGAALRAELAAVPRLRAEPMAETLLEAVPRARANA